MPADKQKKRSEEDDQQQKTVIGWLEMVDFPAWGIEGLKAKVDTGARTSALHVEELMVGRGGIAHFVVVLSRRYAHRRVRVSAPVVKWGRVRSSTGQYSVRCFIRTRIRIGHVEKEIDISLVSREKMMFRMLVGRTALERDFLVDVSKRHILTDSTSPKRRRSPR